MKRDLRTIRLAVLLVILAAVLGLGCGDEEALDPESPDFNQFALEMADALAVQDLERLIAVTTRVRFTCDEQLVQALAACAGLQPGTEAQGFDVKFQGRGAETTILDSAQIRLLLEGMFNPDFSAAPDAAGGPNLQLYSTLYPDGTLFIPGDESTLPERGTLAITYIGISPGEFDNVSKRRLFAAVAEKGGDGTWKVRLWLAGFYRPDHPALSPGQSNDYVRFVPPEF